DARGDARPFTSLEADLRRELQSARPSAAEKRIADSYITCSSERVRTDATTCAVESVYHRIGDKVRQQRICEVRMVEQVEELRPQVQRYMLGYWRVLEDCCVELLEAGPAEGVASEIPEVPSAGHAICIGGRRHSGGDRTRHAERC